MTDITNKMNLGTEFLKVMNKKKEGIKIFARIIISMQKNIGETLRTSPPINRLT